MQKSSLQALIEAAESGDTDAQALLGTTFHEGNGTERSPPDAVYWWQRAAFNGHAGAQAMLGVSYHVGIVFEKDIVQAAQWIMRSARRGNGLAITYWDSLSKELTDEQYEEAKVHARRPLVSSDA
ncbi:tetratricopeptide repeat protein [Polaromonas sp.]|uniref:tetratricopeptide repeat protein n=1 Tax=Polaromonas sp. TaxID=1869339 RepID=UPI00286CFDC9|nr:tetratricopeptide repeat protein [Polaromonas sp.]